MMQKRSTKRAKHIEDRLTRLTEDPGYQAEKRDFEERQRSIGAFDARAERPLLEALRQEGFDVTSVWHLATGSEPYVRALPILVDHLQRNYPDTVRAGIARALAVPEAKSAWRVLVSSFKNEVDPYPNGVKWMLGLALAASADDDAMPELIELFRDRTHGEDRLAFIAALKRSKLPAARVALEEGRNDPRLAQEISRVLDRPRRRSK
jgi:hypothetical protein